MSKALLILEGVLETASWNGELQSGGSSFPMAKPHILRRGL